MENEQDVMFSGQIEVGGIPVQVVRKDIENVHLSVYPPEGRVRLAVPLHVDDDAARLAVVDRLQWIRSRQKEVNQQARQSRREMVTGESHYLWGQRYLLNVVRHTGANDARISGPRTLDLYVRPDADRDRRQRVLDDWYREQLKARIPKLIAKWEPDLAVSVTEWGVKQMKTKWGSCSIESRRIWLNLELAKKPEACLEYIVVHEMAHLIERHHSDVFRALMDEFLPDWKHRRALLNSAPLAHEDWKY